MKKFKIFFVELPGGRLLATALPLTWLVWGVKTLWPLYFSLVGLWFVVARPSAWEERLNLPPDVILAAKLLMAAAIFYTANRLALDVVHQNDWNLEPVLPFLLFAPLFYGVFKLKISHHYFWLGTGLAALTTCFFGAYQHYLLGMSRAYGHMNPITFGNTSVVLGLTCIVGATSPFFIRRRFGIFLAFASICAAYASLLSGSKGGWLGLAMIYALGAQRYIREFGRSNPLAVGSVLVMVVGLLGYAMPGHVLERISSGVTGAHIWFTQGVVTEGSVSFRFELWRMAWLAFIQSPWVGVSSADIFSRMQSLVEAGVLNSPALLTYPTIDNQFFGDLAAGGLLGLSGTVGLLALPMIAFNRFSRCGNFVVRELSLVALGTCVLFAEFGLSASLWGQSTYRQFYVSWLLLLLGLIAVELTSARRNRATG